MYGVGVVLAVSTGVAHNIGVLLQKIVVNRLAEEQGRFFARLVRNPLWLAGFVIHMGLGSALLGLSRLAIDLERFDVLARRQGMMEAIRNPAAGPRRSGTHSGE